MDPDDLLAALDDTQRSAVTSTAPYTLVIAGPGSGKTRVLTHRVAWLVAHDLVPAREVLAITFTNKAANEMRERVDSLCGPDVLRDAWVSTFHSMCVRLLRRFGDAVGVPAGFAVADSDDTRRIIKRIVAAGGADSKEVSQLADAAARQISAAKNKLSDPTLISDDAVARIAAEYRRELAAQHLVDFDDLLVAGVQLLGHPDTGPRIRARFRHILVDEYQDTNIAQWELMRRLVGDTGSMFAVGDASQSIYGFRGSTPEAMEQFRHDWPGAAVIELGRNWRSSANIVAVGDAFGTGTGVNNRARLWTDAPSGAQVRVERHRDDRDEARAVASEIVAAGQPFAERAVLVRTHAQTRLIEAELTAAQVPYVVVGGTRFWDRAEVRDALSWVRAASNPADVDGFRRAAGVPKRGLGPKAVETAVAAARSRSMPVGDWLREEGSEVPRAASAFASFAADLDRVIAAAQQGPSAAVAAVLSIAGFIDAACRSAGRGDSAEDREANLDELLSAAETFTPDSDEQLTGAELTAAFCAQAALMSSVDTDGDGVRLSTVHAAKGREFDDVWVIGIEEGLFPHIRAEGAEIDEECRLMFVASTRARHRLTLSWATSRMIAGKVLDTDPSRFLKMLDPLVGDAVTARPGALSSAVRLPASTTRKLRQRPSGFGGYDPVRAVVPPPRRVGPVPDYAVGDRVAHDAFGDGVVEDVSGQTVRVRFGARVRTLSPELAPMRIA